MASVLELKQNGPTLWATLNRPERLNALNRDLIDALRNLFAELYWRRDVRVVVLRGAGPAFCAGLDLKDRREVNVRRTTGEALDSQRRISEIVMAMRRCPQPIVALIDGPAAGGGFALALASDIRVVTPSARMNAAFIRIGLSACDIGVSYFLPRMIGASAASEYMLTGRFIDANKALALGLVSQIVEPDALEAAGQSLVDDLLHATPLGLRLTKEALNHAIDAGSLEAVIAMEDRNQILSSQSEDFDEGVAAFLEKRKPRYAGF
jgi:enoyl-CoA hydratase/carnithine racemase